MLRAILLFSRSIRFQNRNFKVRLTGRNRLRSPDSYRSPTNELIQFKIRGVRKYLLQYPVKDALDIKKFAGYFRKPHLYYLAFSGVKKAEDAMPPRPSQRGPRGDQRCTLNSRLC
jgi:hypothetical protein